MKRFEFEGNRLTLHVKKTPIVIRAILFAFGFMAGVLPLAGMIAALASGRDFHFGYLFGVFFYWSYGSLHDSNSPLEQFGI